MTRNRLDGEDSPRCRVRVRPLRWFNRRGGETLFAIRLGTPETRVSSLTVAGAQRHGSEEENPIPW